MLFQETVRRNRIKLTTWESKKGPKCIVTLFIVGWVMKCIGIKKCGFTQHKIVKMTLLLRCWHNFNINQILRCVFMKHYATSIMFSQMQIK